MLLSFLITLDLAPAIPAHADPGDIKTSSSKTSKAPPLDDPAFTHRLGYQGQIYEDRHGVCNLTIHTSGSMVGVTHVEGDVTANFTISPLQGTGVVYREHAAGNLLIINGEDIPHPAVSFYQPGQTHSQSAPVATVKAER